ncbi:MAG: hypothetical protein ACRDRX_04495 [Pseudonocardiaceae bacterium]
MTARLARLVFEPLSDWPYSPAVLEGSPFAASWSKTRDALLREADHLGAELVVVELDCSRRHLRNDGELRADARLLSGRVRVSMQTPRGPLRFAVDRYDDAGLSWQANLRAVALTLEALRAVERYGAVRDGQQYRGFLALEAGSANGFSGVEEAARWVRQASGVTDAGLKGAYLAAARRLHPDAGGSPRDWERLDAARQLLESGGLL